MFVLFYLASNAAVVVVVFGSHVQRIVLATEETTVTQQVSHIDLSKANPGRGHKEPRKVNGSRHGDSPLLKPTGIQIATKPLPGPTTREHRKLLGVKTMSLGTNYSLYCPEC